MYFRPIDVGTGLPSAEELQEELQEMFDVLLDRSQLDDTVYNLLGMMEVADAYHCRAQEIKFMILSLERKGEIKPTRRNSNSVGDPYYLFRTGELEAFIDACKKTIETGSRRLSFKQYELELGKRGLT